MKTDKKVEKRKVPGNFKKQVILWVQQDDIIKKKNEEIKEARQKKKEVQDKILVYMNEKKITGRPLKSKQNILKCKMVNKKAPLTRKYIEACLSQKIQDKKEIKKISGIISNVEKRVLFVLTQTYGMEKGTYMYEFIMKNREKKEVSNISRKIIREPIGIDESASETAYSAGY